MDGKEQDIAQDAKKTPQSEDSSNESVYVGGDILEIIAEIIVGLIMEGNGE